MVYVVQLKTKLLLTAAFKGPSQLNVIVTYSAYDALRGSVAGVYIEHNGVTDI